MTTLEPEFVDPATFDDFKPPQEKIPDICCEDCKYSTWLAQKKLFQCTWYGILVEGDDSCDEAEN